MGYLDPYVEHCPDTLFLAEADGELVGYLTGCPDATVLPGEDERVTEAITRHEVMLRPRSVPFFARSVVDLLTAKVRGHEVASGAAVDDRWPAHLHINLVPQARGTGVASELMGALAGLAHPVGLRRLPSPDPRREHPRDMVLREVRLRGARLHPDGPGPAPRGSAVSPADDGLVPDAVGLTTGTDFVPLFWACCVSEPSC